MWAKSVLLDIFGDFDGDELHVVAAGGGGDLKGSIVLARQMVRILNAREQKTKITKVKLFTSNLKRGEENPSGGPAPMKTIFYDKNGVRTAIEPVAQSFPFYELSDHKYYAVSNIYTERDLLAFANNTDQSLIGLRPGSPILYEDVPLENKQFLFENKIIETIKEGKIDNLDMSIVIADCERSGQELASYYRKMIAERDSKVFTIGLDMGGDILARFPSAMDHDATHPEFEVRSPNTDAVFLDMFAQLEAKRPGRTVLAISALGGDGELGRVMIDYLAEMQMNNVIVGVLDNAYYFGKHGEEIKWAMDKLKDIPSEVSTNFLDRIGDIGTDERKRSIDPNDVTFTYGDHDDENHSLRGGSRTEFKPRHYLNTIFVNSRGVKEKIVDLTLKGRGMGWYKTDFYIRTKLHYLTEMNDPNNILSRLRQNTLFLKDALNAKINGEYKYDSRVLPQLLLKESLLIKLAVVLALCERDPRLDQRDIIFGLLQRKDAAQGSTLMTAVVLEVFAQIVGKTNEPLNPEEIKCLRNFIECPVVEQDPMLRGFDYWSIQDQAIKILEMTNNYWIKVKDNDKNKIKFEVMNLRNARVGKEDIEIGVGSTADKVAEMVFSNMYEDHDALLQGIAAEIKKVTKRKEQAGVWNQLFIMIFKKINAELNKKEEWIHTRERCEKFIRVGKLYSFLACMCLFLKYEYRGQSPNILPLDIKFAMQNKRYHVASEKLLDLLAVASARSDIVLNTAIDCFNMLAMNYIQRNASEYLGSHNMLPVERFVRDSVVVEAAARLGILSGGEADYYGINEVEGSHALNAAINIKDPDAEHIRAPLVVEMKKTPHDNEIVFYFMDSRKDNPDYAECDSRRELFTIDRDGTEIMDCLNLFKRIVVSTGIVTNSEHRSLQEVFESLGGGLTVTVTPRMPMESGLGMISALALAFVEGLLAMTGRVLEDDEKYRICADALNTVGMTTAWQDVFTVGKGGLVRLSMSKRQDIPFSENSEIEGFSEIIDNKAVLLYLKRERPTWRRSSGEIVYDQEMEFILNYFLPHYVRYTENKAAFRQNVADAIDILKGKDTPEKRYEAFCENMRDYIDRVESINPLYRVRKDFLQERFIDLLVNGKDSPYSDVYKPSGSGSKGGVYLFFLKEGKTKEEARRYMVEVEEKMKTESHSKEVKEWLDACHFLSFEISDRGVHVVPQEELDMRAARSFIEAA